MKLLSEILAWFHTNRINLELRIIPNPLNGCYIQCYNNHYTHMLSCVLWDVLGTLRFYPPHNDASQKRIVWALVNYEYIACILGGAKINGTINSNIFGIHNNVGNHYIMGAK